MKALHHSLTLELANRQAQGTLKGEERVITRIIPPANGHGPRLFLQGQGQTAFLQMNSNSYLGLGRHPEPLAAAEQAARTFGIGPGAVRFISGTYQPHLILEEELARFHERSAAMLFNSAYAAVLGTLAPLISKESVVISDELNHNSIINALRLAKPLATMVYGHLDMAALENCLLNNSGRAERVLLISDGIFSMRGDHAPLAAITRLCRTYEKKFSQGIITIIDDSHGVGVFGARGRGTEEYTGARADLLIGTLGKAFGVNGGYVTGETTVIRYLRETAPCYIYSNPLTPAEAAAAACSVRLVDSVVGRERLQKLRALTRRLEQGLETLGYQIISSEHPIVPVVTGDTRTNQALAGFLFSRGILVTPLSFPVVPQGADEIRLQVCADHEEQDIDYLLACMAAFAVAPGAGRTASRDNRQ